MPGDPGRAAGHKVLIISVASLAWTALVSNWTQDGAAISRLSAHHAGDSNLP